MILCAKTEIPVNDLKLLNYAVSEYRPQSFISTKHSDSITAVIVGEAVVVWLLYVAQW